MKHVLVLLSFTITFHLLSAQDAALKMLDHPDFKIWRTIQDQQLSADGMTVIYRTVPGEGDPTLHIYSAKTQSTLEIQRVSKARLDYDGSYIAGIIKPHRDTLRAFERRKADKKDWPCDTLFIHYIAAGITDKIPYVADFKMPEKKGGWLAYTFKDAAFPADTTKAKKKSKKEAEHLIVKSLDTGKQDTLLQVKEFVWAEKAPVLLVVKEARDSSDVAGVAFWSDFEWRFIKKQQGEYAKLSLPPDGNQIAFLGMTDTTNIQIKPWQLFFYDFKTDSATAIASSNKSALPLVSQHTTPEWSEDGKYLYYGRAEHPVIRDTTLLADEVVDVEVWSTSDPVLYTVQNVRKPNDEKRSYAFVYDTQLKQHMGISSPKWESVVYGAERTGRYVLVYTEKPYQKEQTWKGDIPKDLARVDLLTGAVLPVKKGLYTNPRISPGNTFAYGFSDADSTWWTCELSTGVFSLMKHDDVPALTNEEHDAPGFPNAYGQAGWIKGDQSLIFYDRYDLWAWPGKSDQGAVRLTQGRAQQMISRYIRTDPEEKSLMPQQPWLLEVRNDQDKSEAYTWFDPTTFKQDSAVTGPFDLSRQVTKARQADIYLFTKENFNTFPDLWLTNNGFSQSQRVSDANPQQSDYLWGSIRLYEWKDNDSIMRKGLLVLPAGYQEGKTYPVIVNFYEKSSNELHNHPTPAPHRSTINYAFYASRGYVIFNPDIHYTIGMPGESAYKIVVSGANSLIRDGIADPRRMALQGHSWGGYQIAYILTRTNMFACAEAGAAVVNMTSAYNGVRWESGMARLFQYEKEQSRIGKSLWETQDLYLANSPVFKIDKIETPVLLLHNDEDGAVPFEQGIEFFLALRRLGKTAWLLNYRGEPHWPVKWQNRVDFNIRMAQFFDHYLKGAPMPMWMKEGIPALERGVEKGY